MADFTPLHLTRPGELRTKPLGAEIPFDFPAAKDFIGNWGYDEQFPDMRSPKIVTDEQFNEMQRLSGQPERHLIIGVDGTGPDAVYTYAVVDEVNGKLTPININRVRYHTNEVLEDPKVQRLDYTTPSTENFKAKIDECEREMEKLNQKASKTYDKSVTLRETAAEVRRERDRLAVESEKASLGMPLEPAPSRYSETVITFTKKFGDSYGKSYVYAAVRAPGLSTWSVTGKSELTYATWEQVVEFILREEKSFTHRRKALQSIRLR